MLHDFEILFVFCLEYLHNSNTVVAIFRFAAFVGTRWFCIAAGGVSGTLRFSSLKLVLWVNKPSTKKTRQFCRANGLTLSIDCFLAVTLQKFAPLTANFLLFRCVWTLPFSSAHAPFIFQQSWSPPWIYLLFEKQTAWRWISWNIKICHLLVKNRFSRRSCSFINWFRFESPKIFFGRQCLLLCIFLYLFTFALDWDKGHWYWFKIINFKKNIIIINICFK